MISKGNVTVGAIGVVMLVLEVLIIVGTITIECASAKADDNYKPPILRFAFQSTELLLGLILTTFIMLNGFGVAIIDPCESHYILWAFAISFIMYCHIVSLQVFIQQPQKNYQQKYGRHVLYPV